MSEQLRKKGLGVSTLMLLILIAVGLLVSSDEPANANNGDININVMNAGEGCDVQGVATQAMLSRGFTADQFVIGQDQVNWDEPEANERGEGAFVEETPTSATEVIDQLKADNESAQAAQASLLETSGATEEELLNPANWVPTQFKVNVELPGNTAFSGGEAQSAGTRQSDAGEVIWLFVNPTECPEVMQAAASGDTETANELAEEATTAHRAGCGNPQQELPRPPEVPPPTTTTTSQPPPPPPPPPPCPPGTYPENGGCVHINITEPDPCASHPELNIDVCQPPQDNDPEMVGPTPGAPSEPYVPPPGPEPEEGTPAPPPNDGGYDSGSPDGSGTPGGSTCDLDGCTGGGSTPPTNDPEDSGQGGSNTGTVPPPP